MENKYAGMTVNERLYVSGLMADYDRAVEKQDAQMVREILKKVELTEANIKPILEQLSLQ
jgi:ABC-type multidrug transport system ATPase subunit